MTEAKKLEAGDFFYMETSIGYGYGLVPECSIEGALLKKDQINPKAVFLWWINKDGRTMPKSIYNENFTLNKLNVLMERSTSNIVRKVPLSNKTFSEAMLKLIRGEK